jgi:hypothetical protein
MKVKTFRIATVALLVLPLMTCDVPCPRRDCPVIPDSPFSGGKKAAF